MRSVAEKIAARLGRYCVLMIQYNRVFGYKLASAGTKRQGRPKCHQPVYYYGRGAVKFSTNCQIGVFPSPGFLTTYCYLNPRREDALISFGRDVSINNGFTAIADTGNITIGDRVLIGPMVSIYNSDFHGIRIDDRNNNKATKSADVTVGDDVFIGSNVIVLKGVTIGNGTIIAAGAVVTRSIPENSIAAGNPARVVRSI